MSLQHCILVLLTVAGVVLVSGNVVHNHKRQQPTVRFNAEGKLKIVQFTDLHYGEQPASVGPEDDFNSTKVMEDILDWEHPDFVVFTGDLVSGDVLYSNATDYIHMLLQPVVQKGYRWASIYGNHDIGNNIARLDILEVEQSYGEKCYTQQMHPELPGVTNYYIPIYGPEGSQAPGQEEAPVMLWWFFDSQGGRTLSGGFEPYYIGAPVVNWFKEEISAMQAQWGVLPSLVFFHIPPREFLTLQPQVPSNELCTGLVDDLVTPQTINTGIMNALNEAGGVRTIFVGHEHGNAWCCFFKEVQVCYNRHTGYGGYGEWMRGSRIIDLDIANIWNQTNYIRLENGSMVDYFPKPEQVRLY